MTEGRVFLIRHGATTRTTGAATSSDRIGAWSNDPLTAAGRQDAARAARDLGDYPIHLVVSSDLKRGEQTATVIARTHGAKRQSSPVFRSWNLGSLAGKPFSEAAPVIRKFASECPERPVMGGGESFVAFKARALPAVRRVMAQAKAAGKPIALVSHVRVLQLIRGWIAAGCHGDEIDLKTFLHHGGLGPGAIIELQPDGEGWRFHVLDKGYEQKRAA